MSLPLIDIIVATYNRPDDIVKFVSKIKKQTYPNFKVYIIDDCSPINIGELITQDEIINYVRLEKNGGQTTARNYALKKSKADFVVFMDDDAWFEHSDALEKLVDYFQIRNSPSGLMFNIKEPNRARLSETYNLENNQELGDFIACGCAFNREDLIEIGGFSEFLHSYGEETDICLKFIAKEQQILFAKDILLFHNFLPGERAKNWYKRFHHNSTQNDLLVVLMNFPTLLIIPYVFGKFFSHLIFSIKQEKYPFIAFTYSIKGFFSFCFKINKALKIRTPISRVKFRHWLNIRF